MKKIINILLILIFGIFNVIPFYSPSKVDAFTDTYYASTGGVQIYATNAVWANAQGAITGSVVGGDFSKSQSILVGSYSVYRPFLYFDTSAIPDSAMITLARLSLYGGTSSPPFKNEDDAGQADLCLYEGTQSIPSVGDDFNNFGGVLLTAGAISYDYDTFSNVAYNDATLNAAGIAIISKTGMTKFALRLKGDVDNVAPTGNNYMSYYSGNAGYYMPKLYIEYVVYPTVTTQAVTNVIYNAAHYALLNGNVVSNGGNTTDIRGFVYGVTSVPTNPGNVLPTVSGYSTNQTSYSSSLGAYTENITGMAAGTKYYVRAIAHNGVGWAYGDEVNFTTLTTPTISTLSATSTTNTTSILNSQVTFDGNASCNITYGWGLVSGAWATKTVYTNVSGTYTTGQFPALALSSLNASSTYYYMVRIQNSYGTAYGTELSFTTTSGIAEPTNFKAVSTATSVSLTWVKGVGSQYTLIRYSTGAYPTAIDIGSLLPLTQSSSSIATGLTPGFTYYFSAWGKAGTLYSANYTTVMVTTLAANTVSTTTNTTATPNNAWVQTPVDTKVTNIPVAGALVTWVSDVYNQPANFLWYFLWIMAGVALAIVSFRLSEGKFFVAFIVEALWFSFGVALGLIMLWIVALFMIVGAGMSFFGDRR